MRSYPVCVIHPVAGRPQIWSAASSRYGNDGVPRAGIWDTLTRSLKWSRPHDPVLPPHLSAPHPRQRHLSLAAFITNIVESDFSVHTGVSCASRAHASRTIGSILQLCWRRVLFNETIFCIDAAIGGAKIPAKVGTQ